ncbi:MAG: hypothetical protein HY466_05430 [Deltaproteobacteria bacterium]|nr:hypothetical protein [Deltaproteobacteria bacterium]
MALPTHFNTSLTESGAAIATNCDPSNACCLPNAEAQDQKLSAVSTYEAAKPKPGFLKETTVKFAHILVGGPLFGCAASDDSTPNIDVEVSTAITEEEGYIKNLSIRALLPPPPVLSSSKQQVHSVELLLDGFFSCEGPRCGNQILETDVDEKDPAKHVTGLIDVLLGRLFLSPAAEKDTQRYLRYIDSLDDEAAIELIQTHLLFSRHACGTMDDHFYLPGCEELEGMLMDKLAEKKDDKAFFTLAEYYRREYIPNLHRHMARWLERAKGKNDSIYQTLSMLLTEAFEEEKREGEVSMCSFYQGDHTGPSDVMRLLFIFDGERLTEEIISGKNGDAGINCFLGKVNQVNTVHVLPPPTRINLNNAQRWQMYNNAEADAMRLKLLTSYIPYNSQVRNELVAIYPNTNSEGAETVITYFLTNVVEAKYSGKDYCYGDCPHDENYSLFKKLYNAAQTREQKCAVVMRLNALWNEKEEEREQWCGAGK